MFLHKVMSFLFFILSTSLFTGCTIIEIVQEQIDIGRNERAMGQYRRPNDTNIVNLCEVDEETRREYINKYVEQYNRQTGTTDESYEKWSQICR